MIADRASRLVEALKPLYPEVEATENHGYLSISVPVETLEPAARILKERLGYRYLSMVTAVDWPDRIDVIYLVFALEHPQLVQQLILVGPVVSGFPYSDHFLNRNVAASEPLRHNDVAGAIRNWSRDPYLIAPGHEAAQKRLAELLTTNPQDMTHAEYIRPSRAALHRLKEIHVPALILVGDADIPDVHAHAGAIEAGSRAPTGWW